MKTALTLAPLGALIVAGLAWGQEACDHKQLRALVGCEEAVYFRGSATLTEGSAEVSLPAWFESFTRSEGRTLQLTCMDGWSPLYASPIASGKFTVRTTDAGSRTQAFWWEVKAVVANTVNPGAAR